MGLACYHKRAFCDIESRQLTTYSKTGVIAVVTAMATAKNDSKKSVLLLNFGTASPMVNSKNGSKLN